MESQIIECVSILRTSNNNQDIQDATIFLSQLIQEPYSIEALVNVYFSSTDQYDRQHAIIYLIKSIKFSWNLFDNENQFSIFNILKDILIKEEIWFLRNLIIDAIQYIVVSSELYDPLLSFISESTENGSNEYLLISLVLSPVIKYINEPIADLLISILERGFLNTEEMTQLQLEIKISSLDLLLFIYPKLFQYEPFIELFPTFLESSIEILDYCGTDYNLLKRVTKFYIYALDQNLFIDPIPLLEKLLLFFVSNSEEEEGEEQKDLNVLLLVFNVIQTICHFYPDAVLSSENLSDIINLTVALSSYLYQPDDSLSLSYSDFFESIYSDLCATEEVLQAMWDSITAITTDDAGQFFACCVLHATLRNFPSFFDDKLNEISQLLYDSLSDGKRLLQEAAARTTTVFVGLFEKDLELSIELVNAVLVASKYDTSSCLLLYLADLFNTIRDTEEIFDEAFPFFMEVLASGSFELRAASLSALSALTCGSTVKINVNFVSLFSVLNELIQSSNEFFDQLKPPAIETLGRAISAASVEMFSDEVFEFVSFCVENFENDEDLLLASSCLSAVEFILQSHLNVFLDVVEPAVPLLCDYALKDISSMCKMSAIDMIDKHILSNFDQSAQNENANESEEEDESCECYDDDDEFDFAFDSSPPILITAISLRILSFLVKEDVDLCNEIGQHIIQCCVMQSKSFSIVCQAASLFSMGNLAEAIAMSRDPKFETFTATMIFLLYSHIVELKHKMAKEADLLVVGFDSVTKIVKWHEYQSLGIYLKPILDFSYEILCQISSDPSYDTNASKVAESISSLLGMIASSAEDEAPHLLSGFLSFYIENMANHSELRFRSLAARFFSDLLSSSSESLDDEFKANVLSFAVQMADEDFDQFAFACLKNFASNEEDIELAKEISGDVYRICMEKITFPTCKSKKFFLMRDNAISTLALFGLNVIGEDLDLDEFLPPFLNALPIVIDYSENESVMEFFLWLFNKCQDPSYYELFLRVLIVLFSNPISVMNKLQLTQQLQSSLLDLLLQLMEKHPNPSYFVSNVLEGDDERALILENYLNENEKDQDESE